MLRRILTLLIFLLLFSNLAFSQKDAPVAGHAATLVELLKKDYNAIDPESRKAEISRDRTLVISIMKSYLADADKSRSQIEKYAATNVLVSKSFDNYNNAKKQLAALTASPPQSSKAEELSSYSTNANDLSNSVDQRRNDYFDNLYNLDVLELDNLKLNYKKTGNNYLYIILEDFILKYKQLNSGNADSFSSNSAITTTQKSIFGIPGDMAFQVIVSELAEILAKRIKEELTLYAVQRVQYWLRNPGSDDQMAELKILLPTTTTYFMSLSGQSYLNVKLLREHIQNDLNNMLGNAKNLRAAPRVKRLIAANPDLDFALEGLGILSDLSGMKSPMDYFTVLENSPNLNRWKSGTDLVRLNIANGIFMSSMLAKSMSVSENGETRFAGMDFFNKYASDTNFYILYTGFLTQQNLKYYNISFRTIDNTGGVATHLLATDLRMVTSNTTPRKINEVKEAFKIVLNLAAKNTEKVYKLSTEIRKLNKSDKPLLPDSLHEFIGSVISMGQDIVNAADTMVIMVNKIQQNDQQNRMAIGFKKSSAAYFQVASVTNDIIRDLQKHKYAIAVMKVIDIAAGLPQSNRSEWSNADMDGLADFVADNKTKAWVTVSKVLANKKGVKSFSNAEKEAFQLLYLEAIRLGIFNTEHGADSEITSFLNELKTVSRAVIADKDFDGTSLLKTYHESLKVHYFLIGYYAGMDVSGMIAERLEQLSKYEVNQVRIFTSDDSESLKTAMEKYYTAFFSNYYIKGNNSETSMLSESRGALENRIKAIAVLLPQSYSSRINPQVLKLISFVIEVATTEDEKTIPGSLNELISQTGSYIDKRNSNFSLAINAYPGILPAAELSWKPEKAAWAPSIGFTAPVGLAFNWGNKGGTSDGIFLPVIDIGALTRVRLDSSKDTKALPELEFKNVFSPGIYYTHGFRNTPLAINIGMQYGPDLKEVSYDSSGTAVTKSYESMRFGIGLVLDIPLFSITNKPRP